MNKPTLKEQAHGEIEKIFRILLPQNGLLQGTKKTLRGTEREKKLHRNEGECYAHLNMLPCYKSFLLLKRIRLWDNRI